MAKKIYSVSVEINTEGHMLVEAENETHAKAKAQKLLDAGTGDVQLLPSGGGESTATRTDEIDALDLDSNDKSQIAFNEDSYQELIADAE